ncbi:hypothetical protein LEN26_020378 [Aphanomyces euteiches]|nr:hypothetical protein LEN26_020378 [Aphanomyces euteiches]KAH9117239.1 hypothetical protein AeMF1_008962 [Aphanomyces euteiches]KAH9187576.1 hypothetical protein AeNC1_010452 [Aphanomyces euteiches]
MSLIADSKNPSYMAIPVNEPATKEEPNTTQAEEEPDSIWFKMFLCLVYVIAIPLVVVYVLTLFLIVSAFQIIVMIVNAIFWTFVVIIGTVCQIHEWLGWKHEAASFRLLLELKYHDAEFYRATAKHFDALVSDSEKSAIKTVSALVKAQVENVSQLIEGGKSFITAKDAMALSSVVVSAMFYAAYLFYFWHQGFEIGQVNSKVHDALAIILPLLLQEELAVALSQVLLAGKWITANFDFDSMTTSWILKWMPWYHPEEDDDKEEHNEDGTVKPRTPEQIARAKAILRKYKLEFDNRVNQLCLSVGVGAIDMNGASTFITSLWTLIFLIQGYIVESIAGADNSNHLFKSVDNEVRSMAWVYWFFVYYSGALVLFCFLPFFSKSSEEQKEDFESVASSCETYLTIKNLTNLQDRITAVLTNEGAKDAATAYPIIRRLRQQAIHQLQTNDIISYALYVLALYTYDFFTGEVDGVAIEDLKKNHAEEKEQYQLMPINQEMSYYWDSTIGEVVEGGNVDDAIPSFLLRVPSENEEENVTPPKEMTLFSIPIMGIHTFENVLTERKITDLSSIYDNQLVQEKKIYLCQDKTHADLVCIGLEVKIMEHYIVSIYLVAAEGAKFGHGRVYVVANTLQSEIEVVTESSETPLGFIEVAEEDQLRAFAMCTLDIDPTLVTRPLNVVA